MGIPIRVLIVEDSQADADLLVRDLLRGGYDPAYDRVQTPEAMTAALDRQGWDIIFSDFTMPHFSGTDALNVVLGKGVDIPFIFVSGTIGEDTAVEAMKAGANDYIMKENLKRLIPAVERELRQAKSRNDLRQTEKAFRQSEARFRRIFESNMEGIIFWDFNGNITETNDAFLKIVGYTKEDVLMRRVHWKDMTPPQYDHLDKKVLDELAAKGVCTPFEKEFLHKDGRRIPIILGAALLDGFQGHGVSFVIDITDRKQAEVLVQQMAFYDTLTGLPNRNKLYDRLLNAIRVNSADGKPFALLLMDLDHFKDINDTLGHQRGDLLLKEVGVRLQSVLFEPDTVARLGGDEFGVVLSHLSAPDHIHVAIKKIEKALETPFIVEGLPVAVEASIGVAIYPDHGGNPDSLLQRADIAMYAAKEAGVGHLIYDAKLDKHSPRRLALMGELRNAIEGNQLVLHYQPKIGMKTGRIIGAEALVRWIHPEHGFI
ncbi:MAG TPA: diguanylate cyclase, partial [Nitrospiria bacterium]